MFSCAVLLSLQGGLFRTFHKSVLKNKEGMGWDYRVMSLSHNVPLLGTHGGISYNPCLALLQFGRAKREGPHEMLMPHIIFDFQGDSDEQHRRFIRA